MENEFFDEARRCASCGIVTYCDNCPICGRKLPRTNPAFMKLRRSKAVAGEEDVILQPVGNKDFTDHMANRSRNQKTKETLFEKVDHIDPADIIKKKRNKQGEAVYPNDQRNKKVSIFLAMAVIAAVLCIIIGQSIFEESSSSVSDWSEAQDDFHGTIEQRTSIKGNRGEIEVSDYSFQSMNEESLLSISNTGDRSFHTDVYLYAQDEMIGSYEDVYMLPNESFDLSIYTHTIADSYEFKNYEFHEISTTKPDFEYVSYNAYGSAEVEVEKTLEKEELEILITYLYTASLYSVDDELYYLNITTPYKTIYEVYIQDKDAVIYETNRKGDIIDSYEIALPNTDTNSIGENL